jgi:hypothetical protein
MDGKGAWRDNRMIKRLWRSLKYECVYLNAFDRHQRCELGSANGRPTTNLNAHIRPTAY